MLMLGGWETDECLVRSGLLEGLMGALGVGSSVGFVHF